MVSIALAGGLFAVASPQNASAAEVEACSETNQYTFSPALGVALTSGSVGFNYSKDTCAGVAVNEDGDLLKISQLGPGGSGSMSMSYFGNCSLTFVQSSLDAIGARLIIGGVVQVTAVQSSIVDERHVKVGALIPSGICPIESAYGIGQASTFVRRAGV